MCSTGKRELNSFERNQINSMKSSFMDHEDGSRARYPKLLLQNALDFSYNERLLELKGYFRFP